MSDEKTEFITSGIYPISRNPAFLGFDLVYSGKTLRLLDDLYPYRQQVVDFEMNAY